MQDQPLKALHNDRSHCYKLIVVITRWAGPLWYWYYGAGLRHMGRTSWLREMLKMSMKTSLSSSAQSFKTAKEIYLLIAPFEYFFVLPHSTIKCPCLVSSVQKIHRYLPDSFPYHFSCTLSVMWKLSLPVRACLNSSLSNLYSSPYIIQFFT